MASILFVRFGMVWVSDIVSRLEGIGIAPARVLNVIDETAAASMIKNKEVKVVILPSALLDESDGKLVRACGKFGMPFIAIINAESKIAYSKARFLSLHGAKGIFCGDFLAPEPKSCLALEHFLFLIKNIMSKV